MPRRTRYEMVRPTLSVAHFRLDDLTSKKRKERFDFRSRSGNVFSVGVRNLPGVEVRVGYWIRTFTKRRHLKSASVCPSPPELR